MNRKPRVPQSNIDKSDDPRIFLEQQKIVVRMLNDLSPQGSKRLTLEEYQKNNGIKRVYGYE